MIKTTKEIILDSFKNQEFVTNMSEIVWLEDCSERWLPESEVKEIFKKIESLAKSCCKGKIMMIHQCDFDKEILKQEE